MARSVRLAGRWISLIALPASVAFAQTVNIPRFSGHASRLPIGDAAHRQAAFDLSSLPVYFEKDPGSQRFQSRTATSGLLFDSGGFWLGAGTDGTSVRVNFQGARRGVEPAGEGPLQAFSNYFIGNDPSQWSTRQHYAGVRYDSLWPGINAVFYAQRNNLEYDFDIAPNADPSRIRLQVAGAQALSIDEAGELWIVTDSGKVKQRRPVIYQEIDGRRVEVAGGYRMAGKNRVGFWVGSYDHRHQLVIDPVLLFSTYMGGSGYDLAMAVAVDPAANIYVTGYTQFADFKTTPAGTRLTRSASVGPNVFVVKIDAKTRQIDYINYWGGSLYDFPWKIVVDSNGYAWVVGETLSSDIPLVSPILSNPQLINLINGSGQAETYGFVARFSPTGSLTLSTYTAPGSLFGIALTSNGSAWVGGDTICYTIGSDVTNSRLHEFQPTGGAAQSSCSNIQVEIDETGYLMLLSANGNVQYSTFYVPTSGNGQTNGLSDVAVDSQGNAYVAGSMVGQFNVVRAVPNGASYINQAEPNLACEVTKFTPSGQPVWVQTLQGSQDQECLRIAVDNNANVYITGYTTSSNFPVTKGAFQTTIGSPGTVPNTQFNPLGNITNRPLWDAFAAEYNTSGTLLYSTYLGGSADDYGFGIAVNSSGNAYITGYTNSPNFPVTPGAVQTAYGGGQGDAYVTGFSADGTQLTFSTFFGGSGQDEGFQTAVDSLGNVYLAAGSASTDVKLTNDALLNTVQNVDGVIAEFNLQTCNPTVAPSIPLLSANSGTVNLAITTDVPGCAWTLNTVSPWLHFNTASGNGNQTVSAGVDANSSQQSRLAIITANARRTFLYQAGQTACQFIFTPGEMALPSTSARELILVQPASSTCTWTATSDQPWLHILSSGGGPGSGTVTIGTDQNAGSVRTGHVTVGGQTLTIGQSAGGCPITLSSGANAFGPAGGIGSFTVLTGSSLCSWQVQTASSWIVLPSTQPATSYGQGTVRFSILPNSTTSARTGTLTVNGQTVTVSQSTSFNDLETQAGNYTSSGSGGTGVSLTPALARRSPSLLPPAAPEIVVNPRDSLGNCNSKDPSMPVQIDANGDPVTVTISRSSAGCNPGIGIPQTGNWLQVSSPANVPGTANISYTFTASANPQSTPRSTNVYVNPADSSQKNPWTWVFNQAGTVAVPLSILSPNALTAQANTAAIPISSANPSVSACNWSVDPTSVPSWITLNSNDGTCGGQLQFNYQANTANSVRTAVLNFTSGDRLELDQQPPAPTPCAYSFAQSTPQNVGAGGGTVTLNVQTTSGCSWSPSTDSGGWITFPSGSGGSGSGNLTVQVAANSTTSQQMAQIYVGSAVAYISEAAGSFPPVCAYTFTPPSQQVSNAGGSFSLQVQTAAVCPWQPSDSDSFVHLQSTASVTGPGSVSYTVDANPAGAPARTSSITVATGASFAITQDAGAVTCTYTLTPTSNHFTNAGGSFTFQVQTGANCSWQPADSDSFVHLQSTASVTGPGSVTFSVDANPAGAAARASSITVAPGTTFAITEDAGPTSNCTYTLAPTSNHFTNAGGSFTFQVQTAASCPWQPSDSDSWVHLQSTASVTGPGSVSFSVDANPAGAAARTSSIGVATSAFAISEDAGPSGPAPSFTLAGVQNGASFQPGAVSPGEIVTIKGTGLGPAVGVLSSLVSGAFPTSWSGTQVLFNGTPAPIIYTSAGQINTIAPFGLALNTPVQIQVSYNNALSSPVSVGVVAASPALFTFSGGSAAAIFNNNFSPITQSNPAFPGSIVVFFGTGAGAMNPAGVDGQIASGLGYPQLPASLTIGGIQANVIYAGQAPGLVDGVLQVDAVVPAGLQGVQPVVLKVGSFTSPAGVTLPLTGTTPPATGTLTANPNPLNVCSATSTATVTLNWITLNTTSVAVYSGSVTGTPLVAGAPAGTFTLQATPNTTFYLVNTSGGGAVTQAQVLSTVTLQQGTCPTQQGGPPPTGDLAQSVNNWQIQFLNSGSNQPGGSAVNDTSPSDILDGTSAMYLYSGLAGEILMTQQAPSPGWNLSGISTMQLSMQSDVTPGTWALGSPSFTLVSANGTLTLSPTVASTADNSYFGWLGLSVPLAGNAGWKATTTGQFNIQDVTSIQVQFNVNGTGWSLLLNAMFLK